MQKWKFINHARPDILGVELFVAAKGVSAIIVFSVIIAYNGRLELKTACGDTEVFNIQFSTILAFATGESGSLIRSSLVLLL